MKLLVLGKDRDLEKEHHNIIIQSSQLSAISIVENPDGSVDFKLNDSISPIRIPKVRLEQIILLTEKD